jgi:hypothetical protein
VDISLIRFSGEWLKPIYNIKENIKRRADIENRKRQKPLNHSIKAL